MTGAARAVPPHPSNRGGTRYKPRYLASGVDKLVESFDVHISPEIWDRLEASKEAARSLSEQRDSVIPVQIGAELLQCAAYSKKGTAFYLSNDDFMVQIRHRGMDWLVTVEYTAAALWLHGVNPMRERGRALALALGPAKRPDFDRISRVDWAMDFESRDFSDEFRAALWESWVMLSRVSKDTAGDLLRMHGKSGRLETMTVGNKASLEVQIYDKGTEIISKSHKYWMADMYADAGNPINGLSDIWRVEIRFGKDYLRNRNINTWDDFCEVREALLCGALETRRLCDPTDDTNRARWPLHPLWAACMDAAGNTDQRVPRGRYITGRRSELLETAVCGIAGYLRAAMVLDVGGEDEQTLSDIAMECVRRALADPHASKKLERVMERYRYVDSAA